MITSVAVSVDRGDERHTPSAALRHNAGFLLSRIGRAAQQAFVRDLEPCGLRPPHYGVLAALEELETASQQVLGARLQIDRSNMVALLDELGRRGLVERTPDPADRRRNAVRMTDEGRAMVLRLHDIGRRRTDELLAPISDVERRELIALLQKLVPD